jgi:NAD(P)-dependent dehydrogenase (short-subunit alcohol dehydrogenase family)
MEKSFAGKVALVTGSSSGIGKAASLAFARQGAKVAVHGNSNIKGGEETVRLIKEMGGDAIFIRADVSKADQVEAMVKRVVDTFGRLDCAYNNAAGGMGAMAKTHEMAEESWDSTVDICMKGVWLCMKYEIPVMLEQGKGAIVNCSSAVGLVGYHVGISAYCAAKHGVIGLTKAAACEYAKSGIRVNAICPGPTKVEKIEAFLTQMPGEAMKDFLMNCPLDRMAAPEEVAEAAIWLCSDAASYITGAALPVEGGIVAQ